MFFNTNSKRLEYNYSYQISSRRGQVQKTRVNKDSISTVCQNNKNYQKRQRKGTVEVISRGYITRLPVVWNKKNNKPITDALPDTSYLCPTARDLQTLQTSFHCIQHGKSFGISTIEHCLNVFIKS